MTSDVPGMQFAVSGRAACQRHDERRIRYQGCSKDRTRDMSGIYQVYSVPEI